MALPDPDSIRHVFSFLSLKDMGRLEQVDTGTYETLHKHAVITLPEDSNKEIPPTQKLVQIHITGKVKHKDFKNIIDRLKTIKEIHIFEDTLFNQDGPKAWNGKVVPSLEGMQRVKMSNLLELSKLPEKFTKKVTLFQFGRVEYNFTAEIYTCLEKYTNLRVVHIYTFNEIPKTFNNTIQVDIPKLLERTLIFVHYLNGEGKDRFGRVDDAYEYFIRLFKYNDGEDEKYEIKDVSMKEYFRKRCLEAGREDCETYEGRNFKDMVFPVNVETGLCPKCHKRKKTSTTRNTSQTNSCW